MDELFKPAPKDQPTYSTEGGVEVTPLYVPSDPTKKIEVDMDELVRRQQILT